MQFRVASYRNGLSILSSCGAFDEISEALASVTMDEVEAHQKQRQDRYDETARKEGRKKATKAGIQDGLNRIMKREFAKKREWKEQVPVFEKEAGARKGRWTMDFAKTFPDRTAIGLEVVFNHQGDLPWSLIRPSLAHEETDVLPGARVNAGAVILGSDHLKGVGQASLRMDSAVGTYERLRVLLPKMRSIIRAPFVFFALDWADGGIVGDAEQIDLHEPTSGLSRRL